VGGATKCIGASLAATRDVANYLINNKAGVIIDAMALGRTGTGDIDQGQGLRQGLFVERFIIR
jgi:hypothetical protein